MVGDCSPFLATHDDKEPRMKDGELDLDTPSRRTVLGMFGLGAAVIAGCAVDTEAGEPGLADGAGDADADLAAAAACAHATSTTRGPFFADDRSDPNIKNDFVDPKIPQRSDIRADTEGNAGTQAGLPLYLTIVVNAESSSACTPIPNAQVHIWHANAQGNYSDFNAQAHKNYLRGYQWSDATGAVNFTTIYPGWYPGRAVHIHVKIRVFDATGKVTTEATTQLFFSDTVSDGVYAAGGAYGGRSGSHMRNNSDGIFRSEQPSLLVPVTGSATTSYSGTATIGIKLGSIYGG
jgi:protocatechuate 3,4-dioxygenase beta subunit